MKKELQSLDLKTHVKIHTLTLLLGWVLLVAGGMLGEFGNVHPLLWIGLLVIAVSVVWRLVFIKCPHCGNRLLGARSFPKHCPNCGEKLT